MGVPQWGSSNGGYARAACRKGVTKGDQSGVAQGVFQGVSHKRVPTKGFPKGVPQEGPSKGIPRGGSRKGEPLRAPPRGFKRWAPWRPEVLSLNEGSPRGYHKRGYPKGCQHARPSRGPPSGSHRPCPRRFAGPVQQGFPLLSSRGVSNGVTTRLL
jgi:hypothetical protein